MASMFKSALAGWQQLFAGNGRVPNPDPGNEGNAPAAPPVQTGSYEYIIPQMYPSMAISDVPSIPEAFQDWSQIQVNSYGLSGEQGGGTTNGYTTVVTNGPVLYYDEQTGIYVNLG